MSEMKKIKWLLAGLVIALLSFSFQYYYLYFEYIPSVLEPYVKVPAVHAQIQQSLFAVAWFIKFWFILFAATFSGHIIGMYVSARRKPR